MAGNGPQRKPIEVGVLSGSTRSKARAAVAPKIGYHVPDPPHFLSQDGLTYWPYVVELVGHLRCITDSDAVQMAVLAEALHDWVACIAEISRTGNTIVTDKGVLVVNPACKVRDSAYVKIKDSLDRLGLNPSNRSKVTELPTKLGLVESIKPEKKSRYTDGD
jgi:P27 family predicted phage terminase small subunit